jgi:hypothetical protein
MQLEELGKILTVWVVLWLWQCVDFTSSNGSMMD